jgi:L-alanine-DL-glutamate epimerase-like enolase superfamily enzyme
MTTTSETVVHTYSLKDQKSVTVNARRAWTEEDEVKLTEYLKKEGYDTFKLRVERMICEQNETLLTTRNLDCISKIEALSTLLRICDLARA